MQGNPASGSMNLCRTKKTLLLLSFITVLVVGLVFGQTPCGYLEDWTGPVISWDAARGYVGSFAVVEGPVVSTVHNPTKQLTYIDLGYAFPNTNRFTIEYPDGCEIDFIETYGSRPADYLQGKTVRVYGLIEQQSDGAPTILRFCDVRCLYVVEPGYTLPTFGDWEPSACGQSEQEPNDSTSRADSIGRVPGSFCVDAEISNGNQDYFAFDVTSDYTVTITTSLPDGGDTILKLLDGQGNGGSLERRRPERGET